MTLTVMRMSEQNRGEDLEQDSRFPSGPWKGYFLQPPLYSGKDTGWTSS